MNTSQLKSLYSTNKSAFNSEEYQVLSIIKKLKQIIDRDEMGGKWEDIQNLTFWNECHRKIRLVKYYNMKPSKQMEYKRKIQNENRECALRCRGFDAEEATRKEFYDSDDSDCEDDY
tara:strand:- start:72 stop:422 length:351 start_codon:yes stop_codon:yes gene_type:complete